MGVCPVWQLADHHEQSLVDHLARHHPLGVQLFRVARFTFCTFTRRGDDIEERLRPLTKAGLADVFDLRRGVSVELIHHIVAGRARVFVLGVLTQRPHKPAASTVYHGVAAGDHQPLEDVGAFLGDLLGVVKHAPCLPAVNGSALHFRLFLEYGQLRPVGRIDAVGAHVVEALPRLLGALKVTSGALVVGLVEAPCPCVLMHPTVGAAQVKHLPRLQLDRLPLLHAAGLNTLPEPLDNAVGAGGVEDIGEVHCPLPLKVV